MTNRTDLLARLIRRRTVEDFVTEAFCWILETTNFGDTLLDRLEKNCELNLREIKDSCSWCTQKSFRLGDERRTPDMLCISEDEKSALLFEHKVDAPIRQSQIEVYKLITEEEGFVNSGIVLITRNQISRNEAVNYHIFWEEIHKWLSEWFTTVGGENHAFAIRNFLKLLEKRGLGPMEKIEIETLRELPAAISSERRSRKTKREIEQSLKVLVNRVVSGPCWARIVSIVPEHEVIAKQETERRNFTWGRYGFHLLGDGGTTIWNPGVFVGVMDDDTDHGPRSISDEEGTGPIACVIVSVDKSLWSTYRGSEQYRALEGAIENHWPSADSQAWQVYKEKKNHWHPIFIYKPLQSLFQGTETGEAQVNVFVDEVSVVIENLFKFDEFRQFRKLLTSAQEGYQSHKSTY